MKSEAVCQQFQDISDNESEKSFSHLINDYNNSRLKTVNDGKNEQISTSDDDSFEKIDMSDVLSKNKQFSLLDEPLKACEVEDMFTQSSETLENKCQIDNDIDKQKYTKKKLKEIDKMSTGIPGRAMDRSISQVSSLDLEEFDGTLVLPQEIVIKWAVQLLLALEKLHKLSVICR